MSKMVGQSAGVSYGCGSSGTNSYGKIQQTFDAHGYNQNYDGYNSQKIIADVYAGKPIFIGGYADKNLLGIVSDGHAWVIDGLAGCYKLKIKFRDVYMNFTKVSSEDLEVENLGFEVRLVHCNWGWDGNNNGYFQTGIFDSYKPVILDDGSIILPTDTYKYDLKMIYNITPKP